MKEWLALEKEEEQLWLNYNEMAKRLHERFEEESQSLQMTFQLQMASIKQRRLNNVDPEL